MNNPVHDSCPRCGSPMRGGTVAGLCARCLGALNLETDNLITEPAADGALPPPGVDELAPVFPHLEIHSCLGRGGMGVVYKARQKSLDRWVALKLLAPERAGDPSFAERFAREAKTLAALNHPHIVAIHDFGKAGGYYFLLMEYVDGVNLRQLLQTKRLTPKEALGIVPPICDALQCAHDRGIVHRDIKPENLLIDRDGMVKIADFGIARMMATSDASATAGEHADGQSAGPTRVVGTPDYAAPEQRARDATDHRADIYSLGVVLYEMLTGERPGAGGIVAPSRRVRVDVHIDEIVLKALEQKPEMRFHTAAEFRTRVEDFGSRLDRAARRRPWIIGSFAAGLVAVVAAAAIFGVPRPGADARPTILAPPAAADPTEPAPPVISALGYIADAVKPLEPEEAAMDTIIRKDGKEIARITNALPIAFSPDGRLLLLHDAAADDDCRHFVHDVAGGEDPKPFGMRRRIGGRWVSRAEWSGDGKYIIFINKSGFAQDPVEAVPNRASQSP